MKRIAISIVLLASMVLLSFFSSRTVDRSTRQMLNLFDQALEQSRTADYEALPATLLTLEKEYSQKEWLFQLFIPRSYTMNLHCSLPAAAAYQNPENAPDLEAELLRARMQLVQLHQLFSSIV